MQRSYNAYMFVLFCESCTLCMGPQVSILHVDGV